MAIEDNIRQGWEYFFNEEFEKSNIHFQGLYESDSTNLQVMEGLFYSKSILKKEPDFEVISIMPGDSEENFYKYGFSAVILVEYFSSPISERQEPIDFSVDEFEAYHMNGHFKSNQVESQFQNQKKVGLWKHYNLGGSLYKTIDYSESSDVHLVTYFNQERKIKEELTRIEEKGSRTSSEVLKRVIYYQELPDEISEYILVSKEGFCVLDKENPVILDEKTPDNVIEEEVRLKGIKYFIWKNGTRELYFEKTF